MPRWRAYQSLEWFIFIGLSAVTFLALVASVTLFIIGRQVRVVAWQQPPVAATPAVTPVSTVGWQTYRNEEYGLEVQYPPTWTYQERDLSENLKEVQFNCSTKRQCSFSISYPSKRSGYQKNNLSLEETYAEYSKYERLYPNLKIFNINGEQLLQTESFGCAVGDSENAKPHCSIQFMFNNDQLLRAGGIAYLFVWASEEESNYYYSTKNNLLPFHTDTLNVAYKILSTFKFIELSDTTVPKPNVLAIEKLKVGDVIVGMTVKSIEPFFNDRPTTPVGHDNAKITFRGATTITGEYYRFEKSDLGIGHGEICFHNLDESSQQKIPSTFDETQSLWFCFSNQEFAKKQLPPAGGSGIATITIDDYVVHSCSCEAWDTARLVNVVKIITDTTGWQTYRSEKPGFTVKYPSDWKFTTKSEPDQWGQNAEYKIEKDGYAVNLVMMIMGIGGVSDTEPVSFKKVIVDGVEIYRREVGENRREVSPFQFVSSGDINTIEYGSSRTLPLLALYYSKDDFDTYDISYAWPSGAYGTAKFNAMVAIMDEVVKSIDWEKDYHIVE